MDQFISELGDGKFDDIFNSGGSNPNELKPDTKPSEATPSEKPIKTEDDEDEGDDEVEGKEADGDDVVIPHKGHQVMIKSIPPEIGRLQLEPVCGLLLQCWSSSCLSSSIN